MQDPLPIQPFTEPVSGVVTLPGSKSITNRALLLAALCDKPITLTGALFSEDTEIMCEALSALGFEVSRNATAKTICVKGCKGDIPVNKAELYVANAGTAARFLTAMLCLKEGGEYTLDGSPAMRKRPMRGLLDALVGHGAAEVTYLGQDGHFPFTLKTKGLPGGTLEVDASASSQILSALLMIAPLAKDSTLIVRLKGETVSHPFIQMTLDMIAQFGVSLKSSAAESSYQFPQAHFNAPGDEYLVEPDATAASYYAILPWVVGGDLTLKDCADIHLQGDIRFVDVLGQLGASFDSKEQDLLADFPNIYARGFEQDFNPISDTFLTLAAIAPLLKTPLTITGIAHTRKQETDRIHAMATELRKLGQEVQETEDSLTASPNIAKLRELTAEAPMEIDTYHDHRVAMSFGILGSYDLHGDGRPWLAIRNPGCCAKTFPNFFEVLAELRG